MGVHARPPSTEASLRAAATVREVYDLMLRAQEYLLAPRRLRDLGERTGRPYLVRAGALVYVSDLRV